MSVVRGIVRLKCVDLANWAAMNNLFNESPDNLRLAVEGMDTVMVHVEKTDSVPNLIKEFEAAMDYCIKQFGNMPGGQLRALMKSAKAIYAGGTDHVMKSFKLQINEPVPPYIETRISVDGEDL